MKRNLYKFWSALDQAGVSPDDLESATTSTTPTPFTHIKFTDEEWRLLREEVHRIAVFGSNRIVTESVKIHGCLPCVDELPTGWLTLLARRARRGIRRLLVCFVSAARPGGKKA